MPTAIVRLSQQEYEDLKQFARSKKMSISDCIRFALSFFQLADSHMAGPKSVFARLERSMLISFLEQEVRRIVTERMDSDPAFRAQFEQAAREFLEPAKEWAQKMVELGRYKPRRRGRPPKGTA